MARDIILRHIYGINTGIATQDVDFAVAVRGWDEFESVKKKLIASGQFKASDKVEHLVYYKTQEGSNSYPIDIIPFGGVEKPPHTLQWLTDKAVMNLMGYEEALTTAIPVTIEPGLTVPIVSMPGLALLKLFAWQDRHNLNSKDARDLAILFQHYHDAGNQERLYASDIDLFEAAEFKIERASPRLLGKDVRAIAKRETLEHLMGLLDNPQQWDRLTTHVAGQIKTAENSITEAEQLLAQFKAGLTQT